MSVFISLLKKELRTCFYSPIAYVVMMIFLTISGYFFYAGIVRFTQQYNYYKSMIRFYKNPEILARFNLNEMVIAPALFNMIFIFIFSFNVIFYRC